MALAVTACEPSAAVEQDYLEFPKRIVTPPCSDAQPPVTLDAVPREQVPAPSHHGLQVAQEVGLLAARDARVRIEDEPQERRA